ncbi:MAG: DUF86 domain-containing protein [Gemmatimonadales bacterium]|nr:DUF86 domain-containing protein [Gemmatimonadales bacterium]
MTELDRDVVRRKLAVIATNLDRLGGIEGLTLEQYRGDWMRVKATERLLQEVVEAAVDVNQHLLRAFAEGPSRDYRQSFVDLGRAGVIPPALAEDLAPSAGLRHRLVHEYDEVDDAIVLASVAKARRLYGAYLEAVERRVTQG